MGLFRHEIQREFLARPDDQKNQIVYKWQDENIRVFSQLTVEQDELAVFFRNGQVVGVVQPGTHTLQASDIPFLGDLIDAATGGNFLRAELYFVSVREFPNLPFGGTVDNVVDPETQLAVGLRVFGDYSAKVTDPATLILNLVGTQNLTTNDQVTDWMRELVLKVFRQDVVSHIGAQGWPILGIAAHNDEIESQTLSEVQVAAATYGIQVVRFGNFTISIDDKDADTLKKYREQVQYTKLAGGFQQAAAGEALQGIGQGAAQGGGAVGPAVLGVGLGLGGALGGAAQPQPQAAPPAATAPAQIHVRCLACGALNAESARFCSGCGKALAPEAPAPPAAATAVTCPQCGTQNAPGARFCSSCGTPLAAPLAPPATTPPPENPPAGGQA
jgi:membrane protease subunit (stomatin/prohibitin family)